MNRQRQRNPITLKAPPVTRLTIQIDDESDGHGLTRGQVININGQPGKWQVVDVKPPEGKARFYVVDRADVNRAALRRRLAHERRLK